MSNVKRGIAWTSVASGIMGILDALGVVLLLRYWISPEDYGIAALATVQFPLLDLLADGGMQSAIVQAENPTEHQMSSAFWASLGISVAVAIGLAVEGPLLGWFEHHPVIGSMLILYGVKLILQNAIFIPIAQMKRALRFEKLAIIRLCSSVAEFSAKIGVAIAGGGVWCFVAAPFARTAVQIVLVQTFQPFRPRLHFKKSEATAFFQFGARSSGSQILYHIYTNVDYYVVNAFFGSAATGIYRAAYEVVLDPAKLLSYIVVEVAFPVFSRLRNDVQGLRDQLIEFTQHNLLVLVPTMSLLAVAPLEIMHLFKSDYLAAAPAVRVLCVVGGLRALGYLLPPLLDGVGRPDRTLRYMVVASIVVPATQIAAAALLGDRLGWMSVAYAWAVAYPIAFVVLVAMAIATIQLPLRRYLLACAPILIAGAVGLGAAFAVAEVLPWQQPLLRVLVLSAVILAVDGSTALFLRRRARARAIAKVP